MIKNILLILFFSGFVSAFSEQKPLMPAQNYIFYRRAKEADGGEKFNPIWLKEYRFPLEAEKRAYLYSNYRCDFTGEYGKSDTITLWDIGKLCKWLIEDSPKENTPCVVGFADEKAKEFKKIQAEFLAKKDKMELIVAQTMLALSGLGKDAMSYYLKFLKDDNEILHPGACQGMSELFKNNGISEETKKMWIEDIIELIWHSDTLCRNRVVSELLFLDANGHAPMDIEDWVSICFGEKDIEVFEGVYSLYPEEFREWEKKEGGIRPLIYE